MVKEHELNDKNNLIGAYYLPDLTICDRLISFFENSDRKDLGKVGHSVVNKKMKDSTDVLLFKEDVFANKELEDYFHQLVKIVNLYKAKYPWCDKRLATWALTDTFIIQKYKPSQAYHGWHAESADIATSRRHLVFMTYLNDVEKGGETEFYHQNVKVKPEKGLTLIWSADWTFTHKGNVAPEEDKYIITGWLDFKE